MSDCREARTFRERSWTRLLGQVRHWCHVAIFLAWITDVLDAVRVEERVALCVCIVRDTLEALGEAVAVL